MRDAAFFLAMVAMVATSSCRLTRPDQENYALDGQSVPVQNFVNALQSNFQATVRRDTFTTPVNEQMERYSVIGGLAHVTVISLGDDRCNPNAPVHTTFRQEQYEVDLIFTSQSVSEREAARKTLLRSAEQVGAKMEKLRECP